ncbi:MAG TPA: hypothetical protein VK550_29565 [Polyangiaceae bacterium]|nr:hypothetical protein [Polyangiaceae bacterium]
MAKGLPAWLARKVRYRRMETVLGIAAIALASYVIVYPFAVAALPPITDLPFHAAETAILRHYLDPDWHFREQFSLNLFDAPYVSMYVVGLLFAFILPIVTATKGMAIAMLALMPVGLSVMFWGMKKSPLWGLLGLGLVWCTLTHWGFLNFMGAIGLFAMSIGFTLLALDHPTRLRSIGLGASLLAVFFTHVYRFPFAVAAVIGTTLVMYPATRRVRPVIVPLVAALGVFGVWRVFRRATLGSSVEGLGLHWERVHEIPAHLFGSYIGPTEQELATRMMWITVALFGATTVLFFAQGRHRKRPGRAIWWGIGVTLTPLAITVVYLGCYFVLPMTIGVWWFVYPREIVTAAFIAVGAFPDMPRQWWLKIPIVGAMAYAMGPLAFFVAAQFRDFDQATADFRAVAREVPMSPKLMYLVFDHSGSTRSTTPFIHLPAWIQAEKGGWLSWHFVSWDLHPIRYRENDANVPPKRPERWEWMPNLFDVTKDGAWFDTFLVRTRSDPSSTFAADPAIQLQSHQGTWWLYRRDAQPANAPSSSVER